MPVDVTIACHDYAWTSALHDGRVTPQGVDLTTVDYPNPQRFTRMVHGREFDACELSTGTYLATRRDPQEFPFTAIPVFPYRRFRHSFVYRRADSSIETPADLAGRRVGIINWQTTTGVWQRGILADRYGLDLEAVEWAAAGSEIVPIDTDPYDVEYLEGRTGSAGPFLDDLLDAGDLDAIASPVHVRADRAERLFDDPVAVEREYARDTGIFPIMHTLVVHDDVLQDHPWLAQSLLDAFEDAKGVGYEALERPRTLPMAWSRPLVDRQREVLGDDPWRYGLDDRNRETLETLIGYAHDQGVAGERYAVDDLFATDHLDTAWFG
jgi:4,5-dihydroxyphthalate decarboxylase